MTEKRGQSGKQGLQRPLYIQGLPWQRRGTGVDGTSLTKGNPEGTNGRTVPSEWQERKEGADADFC